MMNNNTKCEYCEKGNMVKGILEGVSFVPETKQRKLFAKGVYGVKVFACLDCGMLSPLQLDAIVLKNVCRSQKV